MPVNQYRKVGERAASPDRRGSSRDRSCHCGRGSHRRRWGNADERVTGRATRVSRYSPRSSPPQAAAVLQEPSRPPGENLWLAGEIAAVGSATTTTEDKRTRRRKMGHLHTNDFLRPPAKGEAKVGRSTSHILSARVMKRCWLSPIRVPRDDQHTGRSSTNG